LTEVLNGNVIVAHNKTFDLGFLLSELLRVGIHQEVLDGLCTLELVSHAAPSAPRKLIECCSALGLPLEQGHHALNDARMTAHLASHLLPRSKGFRIPKSAEIRLPHSIARGGRQPVPRDAVYQDAVESGDFLASLVSKLPSGDDGQEVGTSQYMDMLDKVISSGSLSTEVASDLVELAARLGLGQKKILSLHLEYFKGLCNAAMADHYISNRERSELKTAALFLKIGNWESLIDQPTGVTVWKGGISRFKEPQKRVVKSSFAQLEKTTDFNDSGVKELLKNKSVLVTGVFDEFSRDQAKEAIRKRGGHVPDSPSRKTFAIVAGRESGPKKLEQAVEWGVPILDGNEFLILLETGELPDR
jgi:hypothetical protein